MTKIIDDFATMEPRDTTFERHYTIAELAALWKYSRETIRQAVKDEPDVLAGPPGLTKAKNRYSVPESVARRIHTKLLNRKSRKV